MVSNNKHGIAIQVRQALNKQFDSEKKHFRDLDILTREVEDVYETRSVQKEMGKEVYSDVSMAKENKHYTVEEVKRHNKRDDNWLMINGKVYDLSRWAKKHPGGAKILGHYAGEDATVSFVGICNLLHY